jgi:hypothetical protein
LDSLGRREDKHHEETLVKDTKRGIGYRPEALLPTALAVSKTRSEIDRPRFLLGICISSDFILPFLLHLTRMKARMWTHI